MLLFSVTLCFLCFFFFFKQKTAYEMRISDWSSDVCSSDLCGVVLGLGLMRLFAYGVDSSGGIGDLRHLIAYGLAAGDRKSVVEGKSVSVRVDLGGRRIIKKKKKTDEQITTKQHTQHTHSSTSDQEVNYV